MKWHKLDDGWFKLNTDATRSRRFGKIEAGGLIRDHRGEWMGGFACNLGRGDIMLAELWGVHHGIKLAMTMGIQKLMVETDAKVMVDMLLRGISDRHPLAPLLMTSQVILTKYICILFITCLRSKMKQPITLQATTLLGLWDSSTSLETGLYAAHFRF